MRSPKSIRLTLGFLLLTTANAFAQEAPPALVSTEKVSSHEFQEQLTLVGRTRARAESSIVSEVEGKVASIQALEGQRVDKGATLVTIDSRRIALTLKAKKAETDQARAQAKLAEKELQRAEELVETSIFPERNRDQAVAEAARAAARLEELDAEREQLELDLEEARIRMPFAGYTVKRLVDVGEWVSRGTAVFEVVDLSVIEVTLDLPERHLGKLALGSAVAVTLSRDQSHSYAGQVTGIAPSASETTHTFPVIVAIDHGDSRLGGGMLVRAAVNLADTFTSLAVPKDAIVRQGDRTLVYSVVDGKARPVTVRISSSMGTLVAVAGEGLSEGQEIVVRGNERIFPGSSVRLGE